MCRFCPNWYLEPSCILGVCFGLGSIIQFIVYNFTWCKSQIYSWCIISAFYLCSNCCAQSDRACMILYSTHVEIIANGLLMVTFFIMKTTYTSMSRPICFLQDYFNIHCQYFIVSCISYFIILGIDITSAPINTGNPTTP
eukprot:251424_1